MKGNLLFIAFIILALSACKNNGEQPQPVTPETPEKPEKPEASIKNQLISKIVTDHEKGAEVVTYDYDDKNRMIAVRSRVTGESSGEVVDYVYTYDDQNNIIKSVITNDNTTGIYEYTYNNGVPTFIKYSQPGNPSQDATFDIITDKSIVNLQIAYLPLFGSQTAEYKYLDGNVNNEVQSSFSKYGAKLDVLNYSREYGTHKNPFIYSGYRWMLPRIPFANRNELLKEISSRERSIMADIYTYTFNEMGYPTKADVIRTNDNKLMNSIGTQATVYVLDKFTITYTYVDAK